MLPAPIPGYVGLDASNYKLVRIYRMGDFEPEKNYRAATPSSHKSHWKLIECRNGAMKDFPDAESEAEARTWVYEFEQG